MAHIQSQVKEPSVAAILFQCQALLDRLEQDFVPSEHPEESLRILHLVELLVRRIEARLVAIQQERERHPQTGELGNLTEFAVDQVIHLGDVVQRLYASLRYLNAGDPASTPPEIQTAIRGFVEQYAAPILNCSPEEIVLLVRPRWTVPNFVDFLREVEQYVEVADLDPMGETGAADLRSYLRHSWNNEKVRLQRKESVKTHPPTHVAVVSFAGLDAQDALDYPLLAHEIAHFIDYSVPETVHGNPRLDPSLRVVPRAEVQAAFDEWYQTAGAASAWDSYRLERVSQLTEQVNQDVDVCLRELTADLLAVRMLGVAYFVCAAEYLKTISSWPEDVVSHTGYPGIKFRLQILLEELTGAEAGIQAIDRLEELLPELPEGAARRAIQRGIVYLKAWRARCDEPDFVPRVVPDLSAKLRCIVQDRVKKLVPQLQRLVREQVAALPTPVPTGHLSDLILALDERIPPAQPLLVAQRYGDGMPDAPFGDVLTAAWLYELGIGDLREEGLSSPEARYGYEWYQDTCQLVFKAIELREARREVLALESVRTQPIPSWPLKLHNPARQSGVASGPMLITAMLRETPADRLFVVPYYGLTPVNSASLDVRCQVKP